MSKTEEKPVVVPSAESGTVAPMPGPGLAEREPFESFGDMVPYADPPWYQGYNSPFYGESHIALRQEVREFVDNEILPNVDEWDRTKSVPASIIKDLGKKGYLAGLVGFHPYPEEFAHLCPKAVNPKNWDLFHELVIGDELSRCASGGFAWSVLGGFCIGAPPVTRYASDEVKARVVPEIFSGEKRICLAITEPDCGSDVASLGCEAKLTEDGKHYIVNGEKKWITNGIWCDYFTTAVRTGEEGSGMNGISMLLIERKFGGVETKPMDCQGVQSSGTTFVTFDDVKVPVENLIGEHNGGFKVIMANFNHERMGIIVQCVRFARVCYEESVKYASKRETFGVKLIKHPVIRLKLAHMARQIEASWCWLENLTYQAMTMDEEEAMFKFGGAIAGLKAQSTTTFEYCAREASQIFGGLSYTKGGQGGKIERLYRDVRAYAIPGGSEEIMLDLSIRQALKVHEMLGMKL